VAAEEIIEEVTEEPQPVEVVEPAPSLTRMANPLPSDLTTLTPLYGNLQPLHRLTPLTDATNVVPDSKPPIEEVKPAVEDRPVDEPLPASASIGSLSSLLSDEPSDRFNVMSAMASMPTTNPVQVTPSPTPTSHQGLVVPDLGSIPVPEDVAAAVRRAITAIEAATLAPTGATPITFGPLHVTAVGQATTNGDSTLHQLGGSSNGPAVAVAQANSSWGSSDPAVDDSVPEAIWAPMPQKSKPPQPLHALQPQVLHTMHPQMQQPQILQPDESADVITDVPADASGSVMSLSGNDAMATLSPLALPTLPPPEIFHNNPVAAPISTKRRGALRRLIDGIRGR
jgi:hypothetical protein